MRDQLIDNRNGNTGNAAHSPAPVSLSVIFPAYNEEANIRHTVEAARLILPKLAQTWEIILVNDGSRDATTPICDELAEQYPEVRAIHHADNRGYGAALKSGIVAARHDFIFFTDSDGQFDLQELENLIDYAGHYEIVTGYRAKRQDPPHRLINAWGWKTLVRMVLGVKVRDIDCAFKIFQRSVFDRVQIRSVGAMVNTEILAQANSFGMRIHEVRVSHYPRRAGKPSGANLRVIAKAFKELFRLWGQLRNVTHEQPGLFRTEELVAAETPSYDSGRYPGIPEGAAVLASSLSVEATAPAKVNDRCFAD
ncbi:MAG TPA: glycosyltransferase family 2 protein [Chthoniobacterales bacterium]|jgi:glycosyltransferase involved in cell wall biosynthesis|nr:glycosyltransferase family 2 protein [Chthoniobacterales bacterium]